jgi:hypothetical protein
MVRPLGLLACAASAACLLEPGLVGLLVLWGLAGIGAGGLLPANVAFVLRVDPAVRGRALSVAQVVLQVSQGLAVAGGRLLAARRARGCRRLGGVSGWWSWGVMSRGGRRRAERGGRVRAEVRRPAAPCRRAGPVPSRCSSRGAAPVVDGRTARPRRDGPVAIRGGDCCLPSVRAGRERALPGAAPGARRSLCHLPVLIGLVCTDRWASWWRTLGGSLAMGVRRQRGSS